jgi:hypothetical protein
MPRRLASPSRVLRLAALTAALSAVVGLAAGVTSGPAAAAKVVQSRNGTAQGTSENWSGYVVQPAGGHVTGVSGTFVVPAAGDFLPGLASTWAGIGGAGTPDLIQAGVAESSFPSLPILGTQYYAWYELLPAGPVQLTGCVGDANCTVNPGDDISVKISQVGATTWSITEVDAGHWSWKDSSISYSSANASAEWILEAPTLLVSPLDLAGVATVHFGPYSSYSVSHGSPRTIASGNPTAFSMNLLGLDPLTEATPSALAPDGQGFNVCAYATSCGAPAS